jgi:hypothetical protein
MQFGPNEIQATAAVASVAMQLPGAIKDAFELALILKSGISDGEHTEPDSQPELLDRITLLTEKIESAKNILTDMSGMQEVVARWKNFHETMQVVVDGFALSITKQGRTTSPNLVNPGSLVEVYNQADGKGYGRAYHAAMNEFEAKIEPFLADMEESESVEEFPACKTEYTIALKAKCAFLKAANGLKDGREKFEEEIRRRAPRQAATRDACRVMCDSADKALTSADTVLISLLSMIRLILLSMGGEDQ